MPRPGLLQAGTASMQRPGMLEAEAPTARPVMVSELKPGLVLEELLGMERQFKAITEGQSLLQAAIGTAETSLCSLITRVGRPPDYKQEHHGKPCFDLPNGLMQACDHLLNMQTQSAETRPWTHDGTSAAEALGNGHCESDDFSHATCDVVTCCVEPKAVEDEDPSESESRCVMRSESESRCLTRSVTVQSKSHLSCHAALVVLDLEEILSTCISVRKNQLERTMNMKKRIGEKATSVTYIAKLVETIHSCEWELVLDSSIGSVILLNAIFMGISMDAPDSAANSLLVGEWIFAIIFLMELIIKVCAHGLRAQYCGSDAIMNVFDATLIIADLIQLIIVVFFKQHADELASSGVSASLFRVIRLLRLTRILRLLQSSVFKDLLTMIQGMLGGMATLCWSVVLFVIFIYVVALVFRETLGPSPMRQSNERIDPYFRTVPRAMFTIFRCSFGDCSTDGGTPLFEHVTETYGGVWSLVYSAFVFIVVIGLFNVISAIFVENTLAAASDITAQKRRAKHADKECWAINVCTLLTALLRQERPDLPDLRVLEEDALSDELLTEILQCEFSRDLLDYTVRDDAAAQRALVQLDIDPIDHTFLGDILDPQNDGSITVLELVDGLKRLRGEPRRSDIITIDLMMRSLQERVDDLWKWARNDLLHRTKDG